MSKVEALTLERSEVAAKLEDARRLRLTILEDNHHRPPDEEHDWLTLSQAGAILGITREAVDVRCKRGTMPHEWSGGWRWIRRDHLELRERAREGQVTRLRDIGYIGD